MALGSARVGVGSWGNGVKKIKYRSEKENYRLNETFNRKVK